MRVENQTKKLETEDSSLCPETSTKNAVQESHLWSYNYGCVLPYEQNVELTLLSLSIFLSL
jgi:hypothetical protein